MDDPTKEEVPWDIRKGLRQKLGMGLNLEVSSIYCPEIVAPQIEALMAELDNTNYAMWLCVCGNASTCESAWRSHLADKHHRLKEALLTFSGVFKKLSTLDMNLIGNASQRREDLIGPWQDQVLRIQKYYILRDYVGICDHRRHPSKYLHTYERQKRNSLHSKMRKINRSKALLYFNKCGQQMTPSSLAETADTTDGPDCQSEGED